MVSTLHFKLYAVKCNEMIATETNINITQGIRENLRVSNYPLLPMSFHEIDELDIVKEERKLAIDLVTKNHKMLTAANHLDGGTIFVDLLSFLNGPTPASF